MNKEKKQAEILEKKEKQKWFSILSKLVVAGGIITVLIGIADLGNTLRLFIGGEKPIRLFREINKNIGTIAEILGIAGGALWLLRKIWLQMKKHKLPYSDWLQQLHLLLRKHHILLGVLTLFTALGHGLYFYLYPQKDEWQVYSGIVSFIALAVLALLGWHHQRNRKTKKNLSTKRNHVFLAIVFGILFLIHLNV